VTALLETLFPTPGDVVALLFWILVFGGLAYMVATGAAELLDDDELEPEPPPRSLPSAVRVLPAAPFDWQHETDL
jgi:hypothetical protein